MKTKKKHLVALFLGLALLTGYMPQLKSQVHTTVDQMPQFPGGETAMQTFIRENLKYPVDAFERKIEGRVTTRFIVGEDGGISDIKVVRGVYPSCDAEVIRVIKAMPKWVPGKYKGKNAAVYFNIPIQFKLTPTKAKSE